MKFEDRVKKSVIKILRKGKIVGTGFWVLPDGYFITCFHVISNKKMVVYPIINIEYNNTPYTAEFCSQFSDSKNDIAVCKLLSEKKVNVHSVSLGFPKTGLAVRSYGYRSRWEEGYSVTGRLYSGENIPSRGYVYNLKDTDMPPGSTLEGMSGAPVYELKREVVVGIQYAEEEGGPSICYVHSVEKVYTSWPELLKKNRQSEGSTKTFFDTPSYRELRTELEICRIGGLFFALYKDKRLPSIVIERLKEDLPDHSHSTLYMDEEKINFPVFFEHSFVQTGRKSNILHVLEIEEQPEKPITDFFRRGRESFKPTPYSIVFWISPDFERALQIAAPEFYSWVSVYDFSKIRVEKNPSKRNNLC